MISIIFHETGCQQLPLRWARHSPWDRLPGQHRLAVGNTVSEPILPAMGGLCLFPSLKASDDNSTAYPTVLFWELNELVIHATNASNGATHREGTQRGTTIVTVVKTHLRLLNTLLNVYYGSKPLWIK